MAATVKIVSVFGTRPEAIKMAPVLLELARRKGVESRLVVTAQHREMLDSVLSRFGLTPDLDLDIMKRGQSLEHITTAALEGLTRYFEAQKPDAILVHGDTTTTFTAALAGFYLGIPVGHIEAGLRTGNRFLPFPEEMNRRLADELCSIFLAPTNRARCNLEERGISPSDIFVTGNTVVDALAMLPDNEMQFENEAIAGFLSRPDFKILFTMHRRESWGEPMRDVFAAICSYLYSNPEISLVYPVHPNPQVYDAANEILGSCPSVTLIPPLEYFDFLRLMRKCDLVLSDSGGVQEEAPSFGKYVIVMRDATERPEVVGAGFAEVCGTDPARISSALASAIPQIKSGLIPPKGKSNPIGDGKAAKRTVDFLLFKLCGSPFPEGEFPG
ncbi:MAG: UDP-N-acetylglucosamine 2-epimerase (non-hydrolyzing) [bacterium]|jgi:UDP-N-acetylglucosamine 2-epimerase (non-hydrolysing)